MKPTAINDSCCGFCQLRSQLDPQLHSHLNISEWISFGEGFEHVECERTFVSTKWSMARWHHPNHIIKSLQEPRHKTQKQPIYAHLHNTLSQCWGMDGHVLRSTSHEAFLRIAVKHLWLTFIAICLAPKKKRFHSTVSYAVWFYCSTLFLPFQQNIASLVITPWPWCLTCKECQKSHHFFQLQRLVRSKYISLIFKPWQPCCFRTEMQYIHSPSMTTFATTLSFKSEKLNPKIMPLLVAGLRNLDNGWLWYEEICSACLLFGQAYILPTSGCNLSHSRKNFQIRWKKKTGQNSAM